MQRLSIVPDRFLDMLQHGLAWRMKHVRWSSTWRSPNWACCLMKKRFGTTIYRFSLARVIATYSRRRASSVSSSEPLAMSDGMQPSTTFSSVTDFHSRPLDESMVDRIRSTAARHPVVAAVDHARMDRQAGPFQRKAFLAALPVVVAEADFLAHHAHQVFGIAAVVDHERGFQAHGAGVFTKQARADVVEGAGPWRFCHEARRARAAEQALQDGGGTLAHFVGGTARKREQ